MLVRRLALWIAMTVLALGAAAAPASAADITGTWDLPSGSVAQQVWTFTAGTGTLAGSGGGGPYTWPMEGTITGNSVQIRTPYSPGSYVAYFVGTVSDDGATMSGTWSTGGFAAAAASGSTWIANRRGGAPTPTPTSKNPSGVAVMCNRGPNPGDDSVCTATVGDGGQNPTQPTGTVDFTAGDGGTFRNGASCALTPSTGSPTVASCAVTYSPPIGGGFPDVIATYSGDATHATATGRTRMLSAAIFGLAENTPITLETCKATAKAATGKTGKKATAAYRRDNPNPLTNPVAGVGDYVSYCGTNFALNAWGALVRVGQTASVVGGAALSTAGVVIAVTDPEPVGKGVGVAAIGAGPVVAFGGVKLGQNMIETNDKAIADPPDKKFQVAVRVRKITPVTVRPGSGVSAALARRITKLLAAQNEASALGEAFGAAIDKAGGAREAGKNAYVGKQTTAAIGFARRLADQLDIVVAQTKAVGPALAKQAIMKKAVTAAQVEARRAALGKKVPAKLANPLKKLGWSARDFALFRAAVARKPDAAIVASVPLTMGGVLTDQGLLQFYERTALAMRYFSVTDSVVAASKLK